MIAGMGPYYDTAVISRLPQPEIPPAPVRGAGPPLLGLAVLMLAALLPRG